MPKLLNEDPEKRKYYELTSKRIKSTPIDEIFQMYNFQKQELGTMELGSKILKGFGLSDFELIDFGHEDGSVPILEYFYVIVMIDSEEENVRKFANNMNKIAPNSTNVAEEFPGTYTISIAKEALMGKLLGEFLSRNCISQSIPNSIPVGKWLYQSTKEKPDDIAHQDDEVNSLAVDINSENENDCKKMRF